MRILTAAIPWLSIPLTSIFILPLSAKNPSAVGLYALIAFTLAVEFVWFVFAKFVQVFIWRTGSEAIRRRAGISGDPRLGDATSGPDE